MTLGVVLKTIVRLALGSFMVFAGVGHFRSTDSFLAQVPPFFPAREFIVQASGVVEIGFGLSLLLINRYKAQIGLALAIFFVLVFPGNISQFLTHTSAFGLNTDASRAIRLLFQPVLVVASLWCTGPIRGRLRIRKSPKE